MCGMKIGYARVSTEEQNLDLQRQALQAAGCETIFEDHGVSGSAIERPGLAKALAKAGVEEAVAAAKSTLGMYMCCLGL